MTQEENIKDKLYVLFQRHKLTKLHIREAVDLAYKAVKENDFIDDVSGFSAEQMQEAYRDGYENDHPNEWGFNINNYR